MGGQQGLDRLQQPNLHRHDLSGLSDPAESARGPTMKRTSTQSQQQHSMKQTGRLAATTYNVSTNTTYLYTVWKTQA